MTSYADVDAVAIAAHSAMGSLSPNFTPKIGTLLARYETAKVNLSRAAKAGLQIPQDFEFPKCDLTLPHAWNIPEEHRFAVNLESLLTAFLAHSERSIKRALGAVA